MFSLLVTLIAIALVAMLALATLYYGGPIFNSGAEAAHAARIDAQSQQIMGAMELYNAEVGHYPAVLEDLVSTNYLKSIPVAQAAQAISVAMASTTTWLMAASGNPVIVTQQVPLSTCMAFNKLNLGQNAVLATVHSSALRQCYGPDPANLTIVVGKSGADIVNVAGNPASVVQIGTVLDTVVPPLTDISSNGWSILPGTPATPPAAPQVTFWPDSMPGSATTLTFADTLVGRTSDTVDVWVSNDGTTDLQLAATPITVSAPYTFSTNCSGTIPAGTGCDVFMNFTPLSAFTYSGAGYVMSVNLATGNGPSLALSGTGVTLLTGSLALTPIDSQSNPLTAQADGSYAVWPANVSVGSQSNPLIVSVHNVGTRAVTLGAGAVTATGPFAIVTDSCSNTHVSPDSYCMFSVVFKPVVDGAAVGQAIVTDTYGATSTVKVSGNESTAPATGGHLTLSPLDSAAMDPYGVATATSRGAGVDQIGLADMGLGGAVNLVVTNTGSASVTLNNSLSMGSCVGTPGVHQTCNVDCGSTLASGASCTYSQVFDTVAMYGPTPADAAYRFIGVTNLLTGDNGDKLMFNLRYFH